MTGINQKPYGFVDDFAQILGLASQFSSVKEMSHRLRMPAEFPPVNPQVG